MYAIIQGIAFRQKEPQEQRPGGQYKLSGFNLEKEACGLQCSDHRAEEMRGAVRD